MQTNALVQPVQGQLIQPLMELEMSPPIIGLRERNEWLMSPCVAEGTPPQGVGNRARWRVGGAPPLPPDGPRWPRSAYGGTWIVDGLYLDDQGIQ